ncbi:MAG TPA: response regulator transcription factor, partial [Streptosporangiaceae bacterium]
EAAGACIEAARQAGVARDERLRDETAAVAERLRTIAEKLETSGRAQEASRLTFAAADAHVASLLAAFPDRHTNGPGDGRSGAGLGAAEVAELVSAWDGAAAAWAALSEPYPLAQSLLHAAEIAVACGDRDGAAESLQRAAGLAAGLGAEPLGEQVAILARRVRIRVADGGGSDLGLTERELEVLRLVAAGRSNREIAAELFISPKTASVHVSNILGKLGAASRGEAAAKAHTLRLFEPA